MSPTPICPRKPCCDLHQEGNCCDTDDCGPCCEDCPTCPTLAKHRISAVEVYHLIGGGTIERDITYRDFAQLQEAQDGIEDLLGGGEGYISMAMDEYNWLCTSVQRVTHMEIRAKDQPF